MGGVWKETDHEPRSNHAVQGGGLVLGSTSTEFDPVDLASTLTPLTDEVAKLPEVYSNLWELFRTVKNKEDDEQFAACLEHQDLRDEFYSRLSQFARTLQVALSSADFLRDVPANTLNRYRRDLKYFLNLRSRIGAFLNQ